MKARYYQNDAREATLKSLRIPNCNPIVVGPTGSGKSFMIADFIKYCQTNWPTMRIMMATHKKELIIQNAEKLDVLGVEDIGIYSAGVGRKEPLRRVVCAGVQSAYSKAVQFGRIDLMIIDEAHMVPQKDMGTYRKLIDELRKAAPHMRVVGYTATPWRLGTGLLTSGDDAIFNHIAYSIGIKELVDKGFLAPLTTKLGAKYARPDTTDIKKVAGEFNNKQLGEATDRIELVNAACDDMISNNADRKKWLIFCVNIEHAEHVTSALQARGLDARLLTSKTKERDSIIKDYIHGDLRCIVNVGILTTGFDCPTIDFIGVLLSTLSANKWVQMLGRGTRTAIEAGKVDCRVADYGGNIERHGPIDQIVVREKIDGGHEVTCAPQKECEKCGELCSIAARECSGCGFEFDINTLPKHGTKASELSIMSQPPRWIDVGNVTYQFHDGKHGKMPTMKVNYRTGLIEYSEYICLQHEGYAKKKANQWWYQRSDELVPTTIKEALQRVRGLRKPVQILIKKEGKYDVIKSARFKSEGK